MKYNNKFNRYCVRGVTLALVCSFLASGGLLADPPSEGDEKPPAAPPSGEGLTRDSLNDVSPQAPAATSEVKTAAATKAAAATRTTLDRAGAKPLAHHRHHHRHLKPTAEPAAEPVVAIHVQPHRNPLVSFVYWWNGLVIRRLHTHIGTVMLGTVGAKT